MQQIATQTGGRFFEAKNKENLDEIYSAISQELRTQYILTYTPSGDAATQPGFHPIQLTTTLKDTQIQTRPGYYIPQSQ